MKRLFLAIAACLIALPASGEVLTKPPVIKEMRQMCTRETKALGVPKARSYCACVSKAAIKWVDGAENDKELQIRLWSLKNDMLPEETPDEELFRRTAEAGIDREEMTAALFLNFYEIDAFYTSCAPELS